MIAYYTLSPLVAAAANDLMRALCTKSDAFSLVAGKVLAYEFPIDTSISCNDNLVAITGSNLDVALGKLVTIIPLDTNKIRDYVKRFAKWRYDQAAGVRIASYGRQGSEVEDFFAVSNYFDKESIALTKDHPETMMRYEVKFSAIYEAVKNTTTREVENV